MRTEPLGERGLSLYGNAAGDWSILEAPIGWIPPPRIGDLRMLCAPDEAILVLDPLRIPAAPGCPARQPGTATPAQTMLAELAGVGQQAISRHVRAEMSPTLPNDGWRRVAALLYAWTEWPDKPCNQAAVDDFLRRGDAIRERAAAAQRVAAEQAARHRMGTPERQVTRPHG